MVTFLKNLTHICSPLQRFVNKLNTHLNGHTRKQKDKLFMVDKISLETDIFMIDKMSFLCSCQHSRFKFSNGSCMHNLLSICVSSIDSVHKK